MKFKSGIHDKIIALAVLVADDVESPTCRLDFHESAEIDDLADDIEHNLSLDPTEVKVRQSFSRYCREINVPKTRKDQQNILAWWKSKQYDYPYLSVVARALLGSEASSGAI